MQVINQIAESDLKHKKSLLSQSTNFGVRITACLLLLFLLPFLNSHIYAQEDVNDDTFQKNVVVLDKIDSTNSTYIHSPKKAGWMSAALPGLGQAYNKKYWKIPVIYAAFVANTYFLVKNNTEYIKYRDAYIMRTDDDLTNDDILPKYTVENLRFFKNEYWKSRDLNIILMAGIFTLNVLDAVVDAHFYTYDISDDLSLKVVPTAAPMLRFGKPMNASLGLSFSLTF